MNNLLNSGVNDSAFPFIILFFVLLLIAYAIYDYYMHKKFMRQAIDSINNIFDGLKTFLTVTLIDRIFGAFESDVEDSDDDSDSDDFDV
jgi:hypothetical protein